MFISIDRARNLMKRDRQCLFRVLYNPNNNKMYGMMNALDLYEVDLPTKEYDMQINLLATIKLTKQFICDVLEKGEDGMMQDDYFTTREVVKYLEYLGYRCSEYKDKYEYLLIISLR